MAIKQTAKEPKKPLLDRLDEGRYSVDRAISFVDWIRSIVDWIKGLMGR